MQDVQPVLRLGPRPGPGPSRTELDTADECNLVQCRYELHRAQASQDAAIKGEFVDRWGDSLLDAASAVADARAIAIEDDFDDGPDTSGVRNYVNEARTELGVLLKALGGPGGSLDITTLRGRVETSLDALADAEKELDLL